VGKSLVAIDTDHIKQYVFGTDKLREIRGASSWLDYLNRIVMTGKEKDKSEPLPYHVIPVCANGGGGLFVVESEDANGAEAFGKDIQRQFREQTGSGASVTYAVQALPDHIKVTEGGDDEDHLVDDPEMEPYLKLLRWKLRERKLIPPHIIISPSHPFMRPCDSCGIFYARPDEPEKVPRDPGERDELYCLSCQKKRWRDRDVKTFIRRDVPGDDYLWKKVLKRLKELGYDLPNYPKRPEDFNVFSTFKGGKDYLALIYADANGMGKAFDKCKGLPEYSDLATRVDNAIYDAACIAINTHLQISKHVKDSATGEERVFPFDILMMGGDDVLMVTPATAALDVALTLATAFRDLTGGEYTLSVGVVLAPIKYPFRLLESLARTTLEFAKDEGNGESRINFVTVAGSAGETFTKVFDMLHTPSTKQGRPVDKQFFATLRPYKPETLALLLKAIRDGRKKKLGRSKLHQMREAIMKMNLTTSVSESRAVLMNWKADQREYVIDYVHTFSNQHLNGTADSQNPETLRYERPFPWFFSEKKGDRSIYRTPLLDLTELYDFVSGEETADGDTH